MPKPRLDPEDFQAWQLHPVTEMVLAHLRGQAELHKTQLLDQLYNQLAASPEVQLTEAQLAYRKGLCEGFLCSVLLTADDLNEEASE